MKSRLNRVVRPFTMLAVLALGGCSAIGQLFPGSQISEIASQVGDAKAASVPEKASFPAAEAPLRPAANAFVARRSHTFLRGVFTRSEWESQSQFERSVPVFVFTEREERGVVEGAEGEGRVCFQFGCSLIQRRAPNEDFGYSALSCNETEFQKVTCASISDI